jgi:sugar lactone lactonase YvrE
MRVNGERVAIDLADVRRVASGLNRPECVVTNAAGDIYTADWRGGIAHLKPDGTQALYRGELPGGRPPRPNGIALQRDGSFLFADLGAEQGGVFALSRDGEIRPFLE